MYALGGDLFFAASPNLLQASVVIQGQVVPNLRYPMATVAV